MQRRSLSFVHEWVLEADGHTAVLLGAGASVPAGLPLSKRLTQLVSESMDKQSRAPETWAYVRDKLPLGDMDVEQLWRALESLRRVLSEAWWDALSNTPSSVSAASIGDVQFDLLDWTTTLLRLKSTEADVTYLGPLVQAQLTGIATLNFDTLVERAGSLIGVPLYTGADDWDGGFHWPQSIGRTSLIKLHGSLNWHITMREVTPIPISVLETLPAEEEYRMGGGGIFSDLRFGEENKLTHAGAMRALVEAFVNQLERSRLLVVVGYSFRDPHIDALLNLWAAHRNERRIIIVDPSRDPEDMDGLEKSGSPAFAQMISGLRCDTWPGRPERVVVIREDAATAFANVFGD